MQRRKRKVKHFLSLFTVIMTPAKKAPAKKAPAKKAPAKKAPAKKAPAKKVPRTAPKKAPIKRGVQDQTAAVKPNRISFKGADLAIEHLLVDPNNYRFLDNRSYKKKIKTRFHDSGVQDATLRLLEQDKTYQLNELKKSILANGYVPMERIIVVPYEYDARKYLVVEGNRRVAALKSLLQEHHEGVRNLSPEEVKSFSRIPCAVLEAPAGSIKHAERVIMGIRHIAGPKEWGAYQQAQLVTELHDDEGENFTSIGEHLGISAVEVSRRYRAMRALKGMEGDELYTRSASPEFYRLFHELVSLPEVRRRFGWNEQESIFTDSEAAREFFELIAPQETDEPKLRTYSDVRKLKLIVNRPKAEAALLDPEKSLFDALRFANAEIEDESYDKLSIAQLCIEMRSKLQRISAPDLSRVTLDDLKKVESLRDAVIELAKSASKILSSNAASTRD